MPKVCKKKIKQKQTCSICMGTPKNKANIGCSHEFCRKCIVKWSKTENSCPVCRQPFSTVKTAKSTTRIKNKSQSDMDDEAIEGMMDLIMQFIFNRRFQFQFYADCLIEPNDMRMQTVELIHETMEDVPFSLEYENEIHAATRRIIELRHRMTISRAISRV
jgi:hypothetical protein